MSLDSAPRIDAKTGRPIDRAGHLAIGVQLSRYELAMQEIKRRRAAREPGGITMVGWELLVK
jgi:hypothetical protein